MYFSRQGDKENWAQQGKSDSQSALANVEDRLRGVIGQFLEQDNLGDRQLRPLEDSYNGDQSPEDRYSRLLRFKTTSSESGKQKT